MADTFYAPNGEDKALRELLGETDPGFYVDVAPTDPNTAATCHFYERGWTGVNFLSSSDILAAYTSARPNDQNVVNTIDRRPALPLVRTLDDVLRQYAENKSMGFLKISIPRPIDVIVSNDWSRRRPRFLCIDTNSTFSEWDNFLTSYCRYKFVSDDGFHRFYRAL